MKYKLGQHLEVSRGFYNHHGIYIGEGKIVHYSSPPKSDGDGVGISQILGSDSEVNTIHQTEISNFEQGDTPKVVNYDKDNVYPPLKIAARALSREGENGYNLWRNNCEHFSRWCKIAESDSLQINFWKSTLKHGAQGALLGRFFGVGGAAAGGVAGAIVGAVKSWWSNKNKLLPVYQEFVDYSTALYFSTTRAHPLGKSFKHGSQMDDSTKVSIPEGKGDKMAVFQYEGSWLIGDKNDWFITEQSIVYPYKEIYIDFHDVKSIDPLFNKLKITTLEDYQYYLPAKFVKPKSLAKFLNASVAVLPLYEKDFSIPLFAHLKEMLKIGLGGLILLVLTEWLFPVVTPWLFILIIFAIVCTPFKFMDKNEYYTEENE